MNSTSANQNYGAPRGGRSTMAELKYRRLQELNARLKEDYDRPRIPVSEASHDLIAYCEKEPKDFMVPSKWGAIDKKDDPYAPPQKNGCCAVM